MAIINLLEAEDFVVDPPTPGSFIKSLMDIKNSDWSAEEMSPMGRTPLPLFR